MIYKYIFYSPVRYLIRTELNEKLISIDKLKLDRKKINNIVNMQLAVLTENFIEYMNHDGIISVKFLVINANLLKIIVSMNHILTRKEFDSLYTDLQGQLMVGIGSELKQICICTYHENIKYINNNTKELKPIKKYLYCLLWQDSNWKLTFVKNKKPKLKW